MVLRYLLHERMKHGSTLSGRLDWAVSESGSAGHAGGRTVSESHRRRALCSGSAITTVSTEVSSRSPEPVRYQPIHRTTPPTQTGGKRRGGALLKSAESRRRCRCQYGATTMETSLLDQARMRQGNHKAGKGDRNRPPDHKAMEMVQWEISSRRIRRGRSAPRSSRPGASPCWWSR